jgi:hypothetical protein
MKVGLKQKFILALGNTAGYFTHERPSKFFWGKCSLPLFCQGIPDTKQLKEMDPDSFKAISDVLMEKFNSKQLVNLGKLDLNPYIERCCFE